MFANQKKRRLRLELAMGTALILVIMGAILPFSRQCREISNKVLRLHILAKSDSTMDQALKLQVRDMVLAETADLFTSATDRANAEAALAGRIALLEEQAENLLRKAGYPYQVRGELTDMYFTTRTYHTGTLPAGYYRALRLTIGSGQGHNWWCVMFPPMCLSPAITGTDDQPSAAGDILTEGQLDIIQHPEDYRIRLKLVEWWGEFCSWLKP